MKCSKCGRTLKDPKSLEIGMGRVCLKKEIGDKQPALPGLKRFRPLFSQRRAIAKEATAYLKKQGSDQNNPTNIITALSALGYLKEKEIEG